MDPSTALWAFIVIGGPLLLGGALVYGRMRNRRKKGEIAEAQDRARH
ncbi:MAG: LPXTG cell wall anchor domain-containing protein [Geminicoccaceae bacterium]|nr:LPXTG cell wall anchor domain-containing protein [Geminicoccaceae bacterium]